MFLNIAGGIRVDDPAIDLSVVVSVLSSNEDIAIDQNICFAGEIGLSGEVRSVNKLEPRLAEADKLGLEKIFVSKYNLKGIQQKDYSIEIIPVGRVEEVLPNYSDKKTLTITVRVESLSISVNYFSLLNSYTLRAP